MARRETPNAFLNSLDSAADAAAANLAPDLRNRLKSVARQIQATAGRIVLFTGAPGTGKTLGAKLLGQDLGRPVFRVDLAGVMSKYIGETEKNLSRLLQADSTADAVLLFDEADALFGKRTRTSAAGDRYANVSTSFLLQRLEAFEGLIVLSTNLRETLDESFLRRVEWVVDFDKPFERRSPLRHREIDRGRKFSRK